GGAFRPKQQEKSSTFRERCALLSAVFKFVPLLTNPVAVFTDNFNSKLYWGNLELDHITNEQDLRKVLTFHENVNAVLWLPRAQTTVVDSIARAAGVGCALQEGSEAHPFALTGGDGGVGAGVDYLKRLVEQELVNVADDSPGLTADGPDGEVEDGEIEAGEIVEVLEGPTENDSTITDRDAALEALKECAALSAKPGYEWAGGVLVRRVRYDAKGRLATQIVVPKSLWEYLVHHFHGKTHASGRQLRYLLQQWSFWPRMGVDTLRARKRCDICQRCSDEKMKVPYGTRRLRETVTSWARVGIDCLHLNHSGSGGGVLLTATCYLSSYFDFELVEADPTSGGITTEAVLEAFEVICLRNGCPRLCVISDGARYFTSTAATEWAKHRMISWEYSLPNSPGCGGWWERRHRECNLALRKWILSHPGRAWQSRICLETVRWLINHMEIGDTGYCPYLLHHGRLALQTGVGGMEPQFLSGEVGTPHDVVDVINLAKSVTAERRRSLAQFITVWLDMREKHWPQHSPEAFGRVKKGDLVLVFTHRPRKLDVSWRGPFPVVYRGRRFLGLQTPSGIEEHHLGNCKPYQAAPQDHQIGPGGGDPPSRSVGSHEASGLSVPSRLQSDMPIGECLPEHECIPGSDARQGRPPKRKAAVAAERRFESMLRDEAEDYPLRPRGAGPKRTPLGDDWVK
ncbi:hypothetical protein FOZ63_002052, partial [Perkinsus olseni]